MAASHRAITVAGAQTAVAAQGQTPLLMSFARGPHRLSPNQPENRFFTPSQLTTGPSAVLPESRLRQKLSLQIPYFRSQAFISINFLCHMSTMLRSPLTRFL